MTTFTFAEPPSLAAAGNIAVPDVVKMERDKAEAFISSIGLKPVVNVVEGKLDDWNDKVYAQDPVSPKLVAANTIVTLHVIKVPPEAVDFKKRFDAIDAAIALLETEEKAKYRYDKLLEAIGKAETEDKAMTRSGEVIKKLDQIIQALASHSSTPASARKQT